MVCMSKRMMQLKLARRRRRNSPLEEFLSYMCCKLLTCQRFQFCSSSVVCTTLTWEQLALCCSGTIALWRVGTLPVLWWVNTAGTAFCVCVHSWMCLCSHSQHPHTVPTTSAPTHNPYSVHTHSDPHHLTQITRTSTHTTHAHTHTHTHTHTCQYATELCVYCLSSCTCRLSV